jgi:hypothetical protein
MDVIATSEAGNVLRKILLRGDETAKRLTARVPST